MTDSSGFPRGTRRIPIRLDKGEISRIHLRGGSILRTSRDNPTKSPEKMANVVKALNNLGVRYLVTIGGDDTAYTATRVETGGGRQDIGLPCAQDH